MEPEEVVELLSVCSVYQQATGKDMDLVKVSQAWYLALDMRMTLEDATLIVVALASENVWISPGAINDRFLARYRKPHEPGKGRARLPGQEKQSISQPAPLSVGAAVPVKPQDVPEYMAKRQAKPKSWDLECSYCGAKPGRPCTVMVDGKKRPLRHREAHPAREVALQVVSSRGA